MNWVHETDRSFRWSKRYAFFPKKTRDSGWIWLRLYWRWQCISGWGFIDDFAYLYPGLEILKVDKT